MRKDLLQSVIHWLPGVLTDQMTKRNYFYILNTSTGKVFEIDLLAAEFCAKIDGRHSVESILKQVSDRHEVHLEDISEEAEELIASLKKNKLIGLKAAEKKAPRTRKARS